MKKTFKLSMCICLMFTFIINQSKAQFDRDFVGNGTYEYKSDYPSEDLHFYLFGDGYYSFDKNPSHQYGYTSNMQLAKVHHDPPYDDDYDVEEFSFGSLPNTSSNPSTPTYELSNKIELKKSWNLVALNDNYYIISFENLESAEPISGCIEFHYKRKHLKVKEILDEYGNLWVENRQASFSSDYVSLGLDRKISWSFSNLEFGEQRMVYVKLDCEVPPATYVNTLAVMKVNDCLEEIPYTRDNDGNQEGVNDADIYLDKSLVQTNPHDPNVIVSNPKCLQLESKKEVVRYRFYFQNIGEDPAVNVEVQFKTSIPFETFNLVNSSDFCGIIDYNNQFINVFFPDIFLPGIDACDTTTIDSTYQCTENVGWVDLDLCYDLTSLSYQVNQNSCIKSSISIIFDNEDPIYANHKLCRKVKCYDTCSTVVKVCKITPTLTNVNSVAFEDFGINDPTLIVQAVPGNSLSPYQDIPPMGCPLSINTQATPSQVYPLVNGASTQGSFEIYPNPALETIQVAFDGSGKDVQLVIMNMYGKVVREISTTKSKAIDISDLSAGTYSITLKSDSSIESKLFIKL